MHHANHIAQNIYQSILRDLVGHEAKFVEIEEAPPMIGLAVGKQAVASGPGMGTIFGEEVMELYFGSDLGFTSKCLVCRDIWVMFLTVLQIAGTTCSLGWARAP
jgi:hypothetical protein